MFKGPPGRDWERYVIQRSGVLRRPLETGAVRLCLGDKPQHFSVIHGGGHTQQPGAELIRQTDEEKHVLPGGSGAHLLQRGFCPVQQHPVPEQIAAGGAGERQGGEGQHLHAQFFRLLHGLNDPVGVVVAVADPDSRGGGRYLDKTIFHRLDLAFNQNLTRSAM